MILDRRVLIGGFSATGLAAAGLIGSGVALVAAPGVALAAALPPADGDMALGNPKAKVQVVEYASLSCTHCAHWNNEVFPVFKKRFIDTGQVRYVFREFLTEPYPFAVAGYLLARRVGQARYFDVIDTVFHQQAAIYNSGDVWTGLLNIAKTFGLTEEQFTATMQDQAGRDAIDARVQKAAERDNVAVTPTFFINGERLAGGQPIDVFAAAIDKAAGKKPAPKKAAKG
jgi:protein-disulfide isomerase